MSLRIRRPVASDENEIAFNAGFSKGREQGLLEATSRYEESLQSLLARTAKQEEELEEAGKKAATLLLRLRSAQGTLPNESALADDISVQIKVYKQENGYPIDNARVTIHEQDKAIRSVVTSANGIATFIYTKKRNCIVDIEVYARGYCTFSSRIMIGNHNVELEVQLWADETCENT